MLDPRCMSHYKQRSAQTIVPATDSYMSACGPVAIFNYPIPVQFSVLKMCYTCEAAESPEPCYTYTREALKYMIDKEP